jgi:hypothetical protein
MEKFIGVSSNILYMILEKKKYVILASMLVFLVIITSVEAQEVITLANDKGVQKSSFIRGEGIKILIKLPYSATVDVLLHNPPGTAGPSPRQIISSALVRADMEETLGPVWLDERAPCGKYDLEIVITPPPPLLQKREHRYFDYAMNEQPCYIEPTRTEDTTLWLIVIGSVSAVAIAAIVTVLLLSRWRAPPPKEKVITPPPIPPTPAPPSAPPKGPHKRTPIVRATEREEE